ncbi:MAG: nucleotide exchange factor GrpE, partial [Sphingomonadaceae bacterium]|nr:nucleotide exchange factor GrpE [Sphingomonadaceae bacterium]
MSDENKPQGDPAVEAELAGVPDELLDKETGNLGDALDRLREDLEAAKQEVLYAKAETQNVRRRLEKDVADSRAYAATAFARDILSVSDNLARALDAVPAELREDDKLKNLVAGIEATARELDKVFGLHGISRIAAVGLPLDPNQHQAML